MRAVAPQNNSFRYQPDAQARGISRLAAVQEEPSLARRLVPVAALLCFAASALFAADSALRTVEPAELTRHPEWASGQQVDVEDRAQFQFHEGKGFDEIRLRRAESVTVRLPERLRPEHGDEAHVLRLQGNLHKVVNAWTIDVTAVAYLPRDLDRFEQGVKSLPSDDYKGRFAWVRWAERRAAEFNDEVLKVRALDVEGEATWIEAERAESNDRPALWLSLANRSKGRLPEPDPSALAHRAFRARIAAAKTAAELDVLVREITAFFPKAARPPAGPAADLASVEVGYEHEPGAAYRRAPNAVRAALDRRLLSDAIQKSLERQASDQPAQALALADQAATTIPDRPEVAHKLRAQGLAAASRDVSSLRSDDIEALSKAFKDLGQPERAQDLKRRWLDDSRANKLSATDATGRVLFAGRYLDMLGDRDTAKALLLDALRIDPKYRDAEDALRRMGLRKLNDTWVDSDSSSSQADSTSSQAETTNSPPPVGAGGLLHGLTKAQVRAKLGVPNQVTNAASQGQIVEQWIYRGQSKTQYINFVRRPTMHEATVEAYHSLP